MFCLCLLLRLVPSLLRLLPPGLKPATVRRGKGLLSYGIELPAMRHKKGR